jgi:hypothetical protein
MCLDEYQQSIEKIFGSGAVTILKIRNVGAAEIVI